MAADGNDTLGGGAGINQLFGGLGDDVYLLDSISDLITENDTEGTDLVQTTLATTTLAKNVENLTLLAGAVTGNGNELKNFITGNDANNSLDGALGTDTMAGDKGNDVYTVDDTRRHRYGAYRQRHGRDQGQRFHFGARQLRRKPDADGNRGSERHRQHPGQSDHRQ